MTTGPTLTPLESAHNEEVRFPAVRAAVPLRRATGSLFGLGYGDALGRATEFLTMNEIAQRYGTRGPRDLNGDPAMVTDDTQMALAVAWALCEVSVPAPRELESAL